MNQSKKPVNRRRLKALSKRITNRVIAQELGISESTFYRYKSGKVKNPRIGINEGIDGLWDELKTAKPTTSIKLKRKRYNEKLELSLTEEKWFEDSRIKNHVYRTYNKINEPNTLGDFIEKIYLKTESPYFAIKMVGVAVELEGEETIEKIKAFSTPFRNINLDGHDTIWDDLLMLRGMPSKQLKRILYHEIVCKQFFNSNNEAIKS